MLERYHDSNPRSITAARMCIEFGDRLGFDSERVLKAYLDFVCLEYSNLPAIHTMVHYLITSLFLTTSSHTVLLETTICKQAGKGSETYDEDCQRACQAVFLALQCHGPRCAVLWRILASFAAANRLPTSGSPHTDAQWQAVFLSVPKRPPRDITRKACQLAELKAAFCQHAFGEESALTVSWEAYAKQLRPEGEEGDEDGEEVEEENRESGEEDQGEDGEGGGGKRKKQAHLYPL